MLKLLHFADAHIDMANYGRHDPESGLPMRVLDFLKSLDTIIDTAIGEKVDLVIFAGDAYKDRTPAPTYQREWGRRIIRLSRAGIPTLLLIGNHDISPASGRATAIQEFDTLEVPHVHLLTRPSFLTPAELEGLPLQLIALPWVSRSALMASLGLSGDDTSRIYQELEGRLTSLVRLWIDQANPGLPLVLTAHASIQGAQYGYERTIMLGSDLVLPGGLVRDPRMDYVAMGHIHKPQNLNPDGHPPVIYPGSIERVDFSEIEDDRYFIIAQVERGKTQVEWRKLEGTRLFIDRHVTLTSQETINETLWNALPTESQIEGAILRLVVDYPREWEAMIDEAPLREATQAAFEFHLVKRAHSEVRSRLPQDQAVASLTPLELLDLWFRSRNDMDSVNSNELHVLAQRLIGGEEH